MVACDQRLYKMYEVDLVQIGFGNDKEDAPLDVLQLEMIPTIVEGQVNLIVCDVWMMRDMCELLAQPHFHVRVLVQDVSDLSDRLPDLLRLTPFKSLRRSPF